MTLNSNNISFQQTVATEITFLKLEVVIIIFSEVAMIRRTFWRGGLSSECDKFKGLKLKKMQDVVRRLDYNMHRAS